jgi:C4-dicarboxylate-specific signal transduction histidine kinase
VTLAKGDTTVDVPEIGRGDELGAMASAVQVFKESIIQGQRAQTELAHVNRVTSMGQLTASIAHEVNQPIAAVVTNAEAALRWMSNQPANLGEVRSALEAIAKDGKRAGEVIGRIRTLIRKAPSRRDRFDLNEAILDLIALVRSEVLRHGVILETQLLPHLTVQGDRVQIQQVILNLVFNAVEAMDAIQERPRELKISTERAASGDIRVTVRDTGPGLDPSGIDQLFEAFYTTKPSGMGMGLAICRSIIEAHGGRMWASTTESSGAAFHFTLPLDSSRTSAEQKGAV